MKRTLSAMLIAGALIIVGLNACTKQDYNPIPQTVPQPGQQAKLSVVASDWTNENGVYVSTIQNILSNLPSGSRIKVYAIDGVQRILISGAAAMYQGHPMWASTNQDDVTIGYSCPEGPMPFQSLHIEIAVN